MKKFIQKGFALLATTAILAAGARRASAQVTAQVTPRVSTLVSGQTLTSNQVFLASAATNTFLVYNGSHPIGLWANVTTTNNVGASNVTVRVDFAYDIAGGNPNAINNRYGTNFTTTTPFIWTFPLNGTNTVTAATNITAGIWEPATAFRITSVSNGAISNISFTLQASVTP